MFDEKVLQEIRHKLLAGNESLAVAESVTAGLLQCAFSQAKDASCFFQGGITTYNLGQKSRHLHVDPVHAQSCDCVSEKVSLQMSVAAAEMFMADWGIAVTGYSTCTKEVDKPYAIYQIVHNMKPVAAGRIESDEEEGWDTQCFFVQAIIRKINAVL